MSDGDQVEITHYGDNCVASLCGADYPRLKSSHLLSEVNCPGCKEVRAQKNETQVNAAEPRPFAELFDTGLMWLINTQVLHPRGYAMQIHLEYDTANDGPLHAVGWSIIGDGIEPWQIGCDDHSQEMLQRRFDEIRKLLP